MSIHSYDDRWLLPRHQTEYPGRDLLHESTLHGRREATFLALAAIFLVATTALLVLGASRVVDLGALIAVVAPDLELPIALAAPLGAFAFGPSFIAGALVCELFGRRRAGALISVGLATSVALIGLMGVADRIDGGDAFGMSIALAATYLVAHASNTIVFDALRRRARGRSLFLRLIFAPLAPLFAGWSAFAVVLGAAGTYIFAPVPRETIIALAAGSAAASAACVLVLAIPATLAARALSLVLRVARDPAADDDAEEFDDEPAFAPRAVTPPRDERALAEGSVARKLPRAVIVDEEDDEIPPFTSAEMRFFADGEAH